MCTGYEIAALVIAVAGSTAAYVSAEQTAEANKEAAEAAHEANMQALQLQREQINKNSSEEMSEVAKIEQAKMAQLRVAAGESGVSGISVDRAEREIQESAVEDIVTIMQNRQYAMKQNSAQGAASAAQTMGRVNSVRGGNWGTTALQIAGAAVSTYDKSKTRQNAGNTAGSGVQTG